MTRFQHIHASDGPGLFSARGLSENQFFSPDGRRGVNRRATPPRLRSSFLNKSRSEAYPRQGKVGPRHVSCSWRRPFERASQRGGGERRKTERARSAPLWFVCLADCRSSPRFTLTGAIFSSCGWPDDKGHHRKQEYSRLPHRPNLRSTAQQEASK